MIWCATCPCLKSRSMGIDITLYVAAVCGLSSTLSLTTRRSSRSDWSSSRCGAMIRHGPHQGAQKSTSTGRSASSTSAWKLLSVTSSRLPATCAPCRVRVASEHIARGHRDRTSGPGASLSPEPQRRHLPDCLEGDPRGHLRLSLAPLAEPDRHLGDREAGLDRPVGELDLEPVAIVVHALQVE